MSLEEKLEEKTKAIGEKKEHPVLRPEIRAKQEEKEKVNASLNRLQELAGLQQNEVQDYKKTKEVIEKLLEKHQIALAEEGITDKKGIISAYPKEKEVKTHLEARQKLKSTAQEIIKERKNLKEAGIEHVRGKELKSDVEKKTESLEEEINKLKSQTPEARRFREKLRRESIVEGQVLIDDRNFINTERLKKVREYGFKDKEIKQIIKDGYSGEKEMKSLKETEKELALLEKFKEIANNSYKIAQIEGLSEDIKKNFPDGINTMLYYDRDFNNRCQQSGYAEMLDKYRLKEFITKEYAPGLGEWLTTIELSARNTKDFFASEARRWDFGVCNMETIMDDVQKVKTLKIKLQKDFKKEFPLFVGYLESDRSENKKTDLQRQFEEVFKNKKESDYLFKPSEATKEIIARNGWEKAGREIKEKIKAIEDKLGAKINLDWAQAEKELFYEENKVGEIENEEKSMKESEKKCSEALGEVGKEFDWGKDRWEDKMIFGEKLMPENWESKLKEINSYEVLLGESEKIEGEIEELKKSEPKVFKKNWQLKIEELTNTKKELNKKIDELDNSVYHNQGFKKILEGFEPMIKALGVLEELSGREMTIRELYDFLSDKWHALGREKLSEEKTQILKKWYDLERKFQLASSIYQESFFPKKHILTYF